MARDCFTHLWRTAPHCRRGCNRSYPGDGLETGRGVRHATHQRRRGASEQFTWRYMFHAAWASLWLFIQNQWAKKCSCPLVMRCRFACAVRVHALTAAAHAGDGGAGSRWFSTCTSRWRCTGGSVDAHPPAQQPQRRPACSPTSGWATRCRFECFWSLALVA